MRVLLVSPRARTSGLESLRKGHQIIQGLVYVAAAARDAGHKATVVIADRETLPRYIRRYQPDLVGVSCVTATYPVAREILIDLAQNYPGLPTIIGGHHATFMYREVLAETGVSYVCRGEGEEVFPALLAALEKGERYPEIPGIVFLKDGRYHNDGHIAILDDLSRLPRISMDLVAPEFSFTPKLVSSRGCPFRCSFCSISSFYGGKYRQRPVETVISELEEFVSWGYKDFWFHDDNLTADIRWVNEFCRQLEERRLKIRWNCMSRVDVIYKHPELFARMAACGCSLITIGLESGVPEVLEKMHKQIDSTQVKKAVDTLNRLRISHVWYMILGSGDEFDHPRYIRQNIRFFRSLPLGIVVISLLTPFPGTEVFDRLQKEGRLLHYDWEKYDLTHCVYRPQGMSPQELERFQSKAYLSIYLGKKWRLIPMLYKGFRSGTLKFRSVSTGFKALLRTALFKTKFSDAIIKRR